MLYPTELRGRGRPRTRSKVLYDDRGIYVLFRVADRYVRCVRTEHQSHVYRDSCVEFFAQPKPGGGYFTAGSLISRSTRKPSPGFGLR